MGSTRIFFVVFFTTILWSASLFFVKPASAQWNSDTTAPTTTFSPVPSGTDCSTSSSTTTCPNTSIVTISLTCTDIGTAGCKTTYYRKGGIGAYSVYDGANKPTVSASADGASVVIYAYSEDNQGNSESSSPQIHTISFTYSISGSIYIDTNGDGSLAAGETTKYTGLCTISAGAGTSSCSNGDYSISGLSANTTYSVTLSGIASGYTITTTNPLSVPVVTANVTGKNFGVVQFYSISGKVFVDNNHDAAYNGTDSYSAQTITLTGRPSITSDATTGAYSFTNLVAGSYTVALTIPANYQATKPTSTTTPSGTCDPTTCMSPGTTSYSITLGPDATGKDFGISPLYSIEGDIYADTNGDGSKTGDPFFNGGIVLSCSGPTLCTPTVTAGAHHYTTGTILLSGTYTITATTPNGYKEVAPASISIAVPPSATGQDFLVIGYKITGNVFVDNNHDQVWQTATESAYTSLASPTISVGDAATSRTVSYPGNGVFKSVNLTSQQYWVTIYVPLGHKLTTRNTSPTISDSGTCYDPSTATWTWLGSPGYSLCDGGKAYQTTFTITSTTGDIAIDFGITPLYTLSGNIYEDKNGTGAYDSTPTPADALFANPPANTKSIVITLSGDSSNTATTTTGAYSFTNLVSGSYSITANSTPTGYKQVLYIGTLTRPFNVNADIAGINFLVQGFTISGNVFVDYDHNGVKDTSDINYSGATLSITNTCPGEKTTNASGNYSFVDLITGTYSVRLCIPSGYQATTTNPVPITISTLDATADFGITPLYTVSGYIYRDVDGNGAYTSGTDTAFSTGTTNAIHLKNTSGVEITASSPVNSNATGYYAFANIVSGSYNVSVDTPTGFKTVLYSTTQTGTYSSTSPSLVINETNNPPPSRTQNLYALVQGFTISGNVFVDYDHNGVKDTSDINYSGATLSITNTCPGEKTTNASGNYSFVDLITGTYSVRLCIPSGYQISTPNPVSKTLGPDAIVNFGISFLYSISGNVFVDINKDEVMNPGEQPYTLSNSIVEVHNGNDPACAPATLATNIGSGGTITTSDGTYTTGQNLLSGEYTFCYKSILSGYWMTYPRIGNPPSLSVTVGTPGKNPPCSVGTLKNASCDAIGNVLGLDFGITNSCQWAQFIGADAIGHLGVGSCDPFPPAPGGGGRIVDPIPNPPDAPAACGSPLHASTNDGINTSPGVFFVEDNSYSFCPSGAVGCQDQASTQGWVIGGTTNPEVYQAQNPNTLRTSYDAMVTTARQNGTILTPLTTTQCGGADITASCNLSTTTLKSVIYHADSNLTLINSNNCSIANPSDPRSSQGCYKFPSNKQIVILVNGDLYINENILVPTDTSVTFSVKGNITVDQNIGVNYNTSCDLTTADHIGCNIEGFYNTDQSFIINGNSGAQTVCATGGNDKRLNIAGSVVTGANLTDSGSIIVKRDLCKKNLQCPTYTITARPDFIINAPEFIRHPNFIWKEEAP